MSLCFCVFAFLLTFLPSFYPSSLPSFVPSLLGSPPSEIPSFLQVLVRSTICEVTVLGAGHTMMNQKEKENTSCSVSMHSGCRGIILPLTHHHNQRWNFCLEMLAYENINLAILEEKNWGCASCWFWRVWLDAWDWGSWQVFLGGKVWDVLQFWIAEEDHGMEMSEGR